MLNHTHSRIHISTTMFTHTELYSTLSYLFLHHLLILNIPIIILKGYTDGICIGQQNPLLQDWPALI